MLRSKLIFNLIKKSLTTKFGQSWTTNNLIPKLMNYMSQTKTSYLHRIVVLNSIACCSKSLNSNQINEHIIPNLLKYLKDKVANVRFFILKLLIQIVSLSDSIGKDKIKTAAKDLKNDEDVDVKFFVNRLIS